MTLCTAARLAKPLGFVYVLRCEGNRFYVGFSRNVEKRIRQHFDGVGAEFTKLFAPTCVVDTVPANGERDEYAIWKTYAKKFGCRRVGGWNEWLAAQFGFEWRHY